MKKTFTFLALSLLFMQNSFALDKQERRILSEQQWSTGSGMLEVKPAPETVRKHFQQLHKIPKLAQDDSIHDVLAITRIEHLPDGAKQADLVEGIVSTAYSISNNSDTPKIYEVTLSYCIVDASESSCQNRKTRFELTEHASLSEWGSDEIAFTVEKNKGNLQIYSSVSIVTLDSYIFSTIDLQTIEVLP